MRGIRLLSSAASSKSSRRMSVEKPSVWSGVQPNPLVRKNKRKKPQRLKTFVDAVAPTAEVRNRRFLLPDDPHNSKSLTVAIIGRPNAGKSSIMNRILQSKVSAVSPKYNTTRDRVLGVRTRGETQIVFYDTPGLVKQHEQHKYVRPLVTAAAETLSSVDVSMLVVDAVKKFDEDALKALQETITSSARMNSPVMLVMNKIDLLETSKVDVNLKIDMLKKMIEEAYANVQTEKVDDKDIEIPNSCVEQDNIPSNVEKSNDQNIRENENKDVYESNADDDILESHRKDKILNAPVVQYHQVSALKNIGIAKLIKSLESKAVEGPWEFHSSEKTDLSELEVVTEIIREKLFQRFNQELPYSFKQENCGWTPLRNGSLRIDQDVFVEETRHKRMVIGTDGKIIRKIGIEARKEISEVLGKDVHLFLNVRVRSRK